MKNSCLLLLVALFFVSCGNSNAGDQNNSEAPDQVEAPGEPEITSPAPETHPPYDDLEYIEAFVGKRPAAVDLWNTEPLRSMLKDLLENDFQAYLEFMQEAMPLKEDRVIYTVGVVPDDAVRGVAYLLVDTENDKIKAFSVFGDHKIEVQTRGEDLYVPEAVQTRVNQVLNLQ